MENRLQYEFAHLGQSSSAGFDPAYYVFTDFIEKPDIASFDFGINTDEDEIRNQLSSIGFKRAVATEMQAFGELYTYIRNWVVDHEKASINTVLVRITDLSCGQSLGVWQLNTEDLDYCEDGQCRFDINLKEYMPVSNCLQNTLIADNWRNWFPTDGSGKIVGTTDTFTGLPNPQWLHPRYRYCDDIKPHALQNFLAVIAEGIISGIAVLLTPISALLAIINTIWEDVFGGTFTWDDDFEGWLTEIFSDISQNFLGCKRLFPSPLVRNYFINACSKCGVEFRSDIFNNPDSEDRIFYNTTHMFAPEKRGVNDPDTDKDWIHQNAPIYTAPQYAYSLKDIFNAKYKLENGVFSFERRDKYNTDPVIFDLTGDDAKYLLGAVCFSLNAGKMYMSQYLKYAEDEHDQCGNEALHRYNGAINWFTHNDGVTNPDPTVNPDAGRYSGTEEINIQDYSAARFTNDGIERLLAFTVTTGPFSYSEEWKSGTLLLSSDYTSKGKLIVWDGNNPPDGDPEAHKPISELQSTNNYNQSKWPDDFSTDNPGGGTFEVPNWPMFYDWYNYEGSPYATGDGFRNIYNLHLIDDPTTGELKNKTFTVTLDNCCEVLRKIVYDDTAGDGIQAKLDYLIKLSDTDTGEIQRIEIDYKDNQIRLYGRVKYSA